MKLNYLSRLTALLLALMLLPLAAFAEGTSIDDLTGDTLETYDSVTAFLEAMEAANKCSLCAATLGNRGLLSWPVDGYDCLHTYLGSMTSNEAYQLLYDLDRGTTEEYTLSQVYINAHNAHVDDTTEELHRDAVICYGFDCYTNPLAVPGPSHVEGSCPWWQETEYVYVPLAQNTLTSGVVTVSGKMPADVALVVTEATVDTSIMDLSYFDSYETFGYNIALYRPGADATIGTEDDVKWQPKDNGETVTVTIAKAYSVDDYPAVDVYHVTDDGSMELLTSRNGSVELTEDGSSFSFTVEEFSEFYCAAGLWSLTLSSGNNHTIYVIEGLETNLQLTVQSTNSVSISPDTSSDGFKTPTPSTTDTGTMYTVGTTTNSTEGNSQTYTISWRNSSRTRSASVTIIVVSADDWTIDYGTSPTEVGHIQINLTFDAVITDDDGNTINATVTIPEPDNGEDNATNYTPTATTSASTSFSAKAASQETTVTIDGDDYSLTTDTTVKIEIIDPDGYDYPSPQSFTVDTISEKDSQLSFNGSFPVGVFGAPVMYRVTIDTTIKVPVYEKNADGTFKTDSNGDYIPVIENGVVKTKNQKVALSKLIYYWHPDNICPGASNHSTGGTPGGMAGIDIGEFGASIDGTGSLALTKTLAEALKEDKTFKIYVYKYQENTTESTDDDWVKMEQFTVTITVPQGDTQATTTIVDIPYGRYMIVEDTVDTTDYKPNIDGYTLTVEYTTTKTDANGVSTVYPGENTYTFSKDARIWKANVKNTYTAKTGDLKITKTVVNDTVYKDLNDDFTFTVTLTDGTNPLTGSYNYTVTDASGNTVSTDPKTISNGGTLTLKHGQTATIADLPADTVYTVTETGIPAGYTVDEASKNGKITAGVGSAVTFTNTYSVGTLEITKTVENNTIYANDEDLADDAFEFTVTLKDASDVPLTGSVTYTIGTTPTTVTLSSDGKFTLSLKKDETATIAKLPDGTKYTVTETAADGYTTTKSGDTCSIVANTTQTAAFVNAYVGAPLTITKTGTVDATDSFIFTVSGEGVNMKVVITGAGTITIANLPLGTYTVTEDTDWSWKYNAKSTSASVTVDADGGSVTFTNTKTEKWLNDESSVHNDFSKDSE